MPQVNIAIGNTYDTITRPVAVGIAKDCLKMMGFDERAYVAFEGFNNSFMNKNNSLEPINKNFFGTDTTATVEIVEQPKVEQTLAMSVFRPDELCIFRDEGSNLFIRPVRQMNTVELTFRLRFDQKSEAMRWRDDINARAALLRHDTYHRVTYSYPIPMQFMEFLFDAHKIIAEHDPDEPTDFAEWFYKYADERATTLTNVGGMEHMVVIPETQVRVLGWFNFEGVPEKPTLDRDSNTWEVEWSYTYIYDKIIECVLYHELLIRQQLIADRFIPDNKPYDLYMEANLAMNNSQALAEHHLPDFERYGGIAINRVPGADTWYPLDACRTFNLRNYRPVFIALAAISNDDPRTVANLLELGDFEIAPAVLDLIRQELQYVTEPHKSIVNISIFSDNDQAFPDQQVLDEDLNLKATFDLSTKPIYRVVISIIRDLHWLDKDAQDRIVNNACTAKKAFEVVYPAAAAAGYIPNPSEACRWGLDQWEFFKDLTSPKLDEPWKWGWPPAILENTPVDGVITPRPGTTSLNYLRTMQTVGLFEIVARRPSDGSR